MAKGMVDLIYMMVFCFAVAIALLVGRGVWEEVNPQMDKQLNSPDSENILNLVTQGFDVLDIYFMMILVGFFLSIVVLVYMLPSHPVFAMFGLIVISVALLIAPTLSNVFEEIGAKSFFTTALAEFPMMNTVMNDYPIFIMAFGFIIIVVGYGMAGRGDNV